jgi:hypothetical protein
MGFNLFGGGDRSASTTSTTTNVTTNTTSTVHDIGLTGQNAVDLFNVAGNVLQGANANSMQQNQLVAASLSDISKNEASLFSTYAGNTQQILNSALSFAGGVVSSGFSDLNSSRALAGDIATKSLTGSQQAVTDVLNQASQSAGNVSESFIKYATLAVIAVGAFWFLKGAR